MKRFHQLLFVVSLVALSWYAMMAVHEFGHVMGTLMTGGSVKRVVLYPLTISRTDVASTRNPGLVVWLGPIVGCLLPLVVSSLVPRRFVAARNIARFFAGFCLVANGAYISFGALGRVGDCGEMLRTGTPLWTMWGFGAVTIPAGLLIFHRLGPLRLFVNNPSAVTPKLTGSVFLTLVLLLTAEFVLSPR